MRLPDDYRFDGDSPVGRYWLVHGVGFTVCRDDGRKVGVVEHVVVDPVLQKPERVIVRRAGIVPRRAVIEPRAVGAVIPASQLFLVAADGRAEAPVLDERRDEKAAPDEAEPNPGVVAVIVAGLAHVLRAAAHAVRLAAQRAERALFRAARGGRSEAPRRAAWAAADLRRGRRASSTGARAAGRWSRAAALRLTVAARVAGHGLRELGVLIAVLVADATRRVTPSARATRTPADEPGDDADSPLHRDASGDASAPEAAVGREVEMPRRHKP